MKGGIDKTDVDLTASFEVVQSAFCGSILG